ncbi:MAG: ATP-binding protein [Bacteroidales bacterium]|nr:ATP-binding protein [Bacteroidales bacterium]
MAVRKSFLDRFSKCFDDMDSVSRQAYLLRLGKERGFFETVFNAVDEGILVVDRRLRIRYFNRAAKELLALPDDLTRLRVSQLLPDVDWRRILRADEEEWSRVARQELEILYPEPRFVQFYLVPLPEDTGMAAVILRDVTESRKKAIGELEKETVKAVSLLAAGVAHEIGNPLNSLYLNLQILEKSFTAPEDALSPREAVEMVRVCKNEVERLDSIIHGFLTAIRPGKPNFGKVRLPDLIVEVLTFMRPEIEARHVTVKCDFGPTLPAISGDAAQLKQCFYNIIRNAAQAMSNGGTLEIFGYAGAEQLFLEFADTGSGISVKDMGGVFQAFKSSKAGGNGIGTMVIERVCREHGAQFGFVSTPGRGTVFQLRFPLGARRVRMLGVGAK